MVFGGHLQAGRTGVAMAGTRGGDGRGWLSIVRVLFAGMHAFYIFSYLFWLGTGGAVFHFFP